MNARVSARLKVACTVSAAALAALWLLPAWSAAWATAAVAFAGAVWLGMQIVSPRSQQIVPTVFRLPEGAAHVALTFDDGPDPEVTPQVLDLLAEHGMQATFFVVGCRADAHPELVRRIHLGGHQLGSHSHGHGHGFHFLPAQAMATEIERGIASIASITGERPRAFRPPVGLRVPTLARALALLPERPTCYTWTERGLDTLGRPAHRIVERLRPHLVPGAILTLHDGAGFGGSRDRSATLAALRELLGLLRERGLYSRRLDAPIAAR